MSPDEVSFLIKPKIGSPHRKERSAKIPGGRVHSSLISERAGRKRRRNPVRTHQTSGTSDPAAARERRPPDHFLVPAPPGWEIHIKRAERHLHRAKARCHVASGLRRIVPTRKLKVENDEITLPNSHRMDDIRSPARHPAVLRRPHAPTSPPQRTCKRLTRPFS